MGSKLQLAKFITYGITLACLIFLIYQTTKCLMKFIGEPKAADLIIAEAKNHIYPAITFCPLVNYQEYVKYKEVLEKCNLT